MYELASGHTDLDVAETSGAEYACNVMPPWPNPATKLGKISRIPENHVISVELCTYVPHNASFRFRKEPLTPSSRLLGIL